MLASVLVLDLAFPLPPAARAAGTAGPAGQGEALSPGTLVVLAGDAQPPAVHAIAHARNAAISSTHCRTFTDPL